MGLVNNKDKLLKAFIDGVRCGRARARAQKKTGLFELELYSSNFYSPLGSLSLAPNLNDEVGRQLLG